MVVLLGTSSSFTAVPIIVPVLISTSSLLGLMITLTSNATGGFSGSSDTGTLVAGAGVFLVFVFAGKSVSSTLSESPLSDNKALAASDNSLLGKSVSLLVSMVSATIFVMFGTAIGLSKM